MNYTTHLRLSQFSRPSKTKEKIINSSDYEYLNAEKHGENFDGEDCAEIYSKCEKSLLEIISEIEDNNFYKFY